MPLPARHEGRPIQRRITLWETEPTPHEVLARLYALRQRDSLSSEPTSPFAERSTAFATEEFARRHMHVRDGLALRAAHGETLTEVERATLLAFDAVLDSLETPPEPLSASVQEILRDVLRR